MLEQLSAGVTDPCMKASIPWVRCLSGDWKLGIKPRILRKLYFLQAKIEDVLTHRNSDCDLIWKQGQCVCNWLRWGHFGTWWCLQKKICRRYREDTLGRWRIGVMEPQAKGQRLPTDLLYSGRCKAGIFHRFQKEHDSADTLLFDLQIPELWE